MYQDWVEKFEENKINNKQSKADKMFEELGYELLNEYDKDFDNNFIVYLKVGKTITFKKSNLKVSVRDTQRNYINMQELQAINEKCKELGWL